MDRHVKVIVLSIALTGGLWIHSHASNSDAHTYVSRSRLENPQLEKSSDFSFTQLTQDSSRVETPDSTQPQQASAMRPKEPYKAFLYALVPGAVLHGAGHFYAGKTGTGFLLVGSELVGATLAIAGSGKGWGGGYRTTGEVAMELVGGALFFGSWIYDMVGAPLAVHRENRGLLGGENVRLTFDLDHTSHSARLQIVKRF